MEYGHDDGANIYQRMKHLSEHDIRNGGGIEQTGKTYVCCQCMYVASCGYEDEDVVTSRHLVPNTTIR